MDCGTDKNCNNYSAFLFLNVKMNVTKLINPRDRHPRTGRKAYLKNDTFLCFKLFSPRGFSWAPHKQSKCRLVAEESVQRVTSLKICDVLLADWSNVFFHIHDDYFRSGMFVCHFEMCAVGARCAQFSS